MFYNARTRLTTLAAAAVVAASLLGGQFASSLTVAPSVTAQAAPVAAALAPHPMDYCSAGTWGC
jgi:hypothetical protein